MVLEIHALAGDLWSLFELVVNLGERRDDWPVGLGDGLLAGRPPLPG